jgi:hypothetical protein
VSGGARYLAATALFALLAAGASAVVPESWRAAWWLALGVTLLLQVPLGWRLVDALGTEGFLVAWVAGMLLRLVVVAGIGLVVVPMLRLPPAPALLTLVGFLVVSLAIESVVSALQASRLEEQ